MSDYACMYGWTGEWVKKSTYFTWRGVYLIKECAVVHSYTDTSIARYCVCGSCSLAIYIILFTSTRIFSHMLDWVCEYTDTRYRHWSSSQRMSQERMTKPIKTGIHQWRYLRWYISLHLFRYCTGSGICGFHSHAGAASQVVAEVGTHAGRDAARLEDIFAPWN